MISHQINFADYDFTVHLTRFSGLLRKKGMIAGPREISDALKVLDSIDFHDRARCYWILRCLFVSQPDDVNFFDFIFESFWSFQKIVDEPEANKGSDLFKGAKNFRKRGSPSFLVDNEQHSENILFKPEYHGANRRDIDGYKNIEHFAFEKTSEMTQLAADILKVLKGKKSRRKVPKNRGRILDFRKLVRSNLKVGSEPLHLSYFDRKIRPPKLTILLDVSGSMNKYVQALLRLCYECVGKTNQIKVYVFSMALTNITPELAAPNYLDSLSAIGRKVAGWSGGTDIGKSLEKFRNESQAKLNRNTTFILMSDGWDTGSSDKLYFELNRIKNSVKSIVWLNPLVGSEDFSPETASMRRALPLIDVFASARDFESLKKIPSYIN